MVVNAQGIDYVDVFGLQLLEPEFIHLNLLVK